MKLNKKVISLTLAATMVMGSISFAAPPQWSKTKKISKVVVDKPVVQEPVVQEPVVQEPVVQEPVVQEPVVQEPVVQEPVVQEPVVQEPVVQEPVVQEPVVQEPVVQVPVLATATKPLTIASMKLYSDSSAFNQKISSTAKIDENSALMVGSLKEAFNNRGMVIAKDSYSASVFYADANTPRYNVKRTASWAGGTTLYDVPVPDFAVPDAGEGHMTIIDLSNGYQYDFWLAQKVNGQWTAGWANKISYKGDGIYPDGLSARGSGFALTAGMIWPEELKSGRIDHALVFSYPYTKTKQYVYPASKTDGTSTRSDAIPMGARVQLDPTLNLDSLGLTSYEKTIARAMQEYGMIVGDTSGGPIELEAVNPVSAQGNAYEGLLPNDSFILLKKIPVDRFRVLDI